MADLLIVPLLVGMEEAGDIDNGGDPLPDWVGYAVCEYGGGGLRPGGRGMPKDP